MKRIILVVLIAISFVLSACGPNQADLAKYISQTQTAMPTPTSLPTIKKLPSETPTVEPSPTETITPQNTPTKETTLKDIKDSIEKYLLIVDGVKSVTMINIGTGEFNIEFTETWASKDRQPPVNFEVIRGLSQALTMGGKQKLLDKFGGNNDFIVKLTSYSSDGGYKYSSETHYNTMEKLANKDISFDDWVSESGAAFR
jgi:hypothetical protein